MGDWDVIDKGYQVSFWGDVDIPELDNGDGRTVLYNHWIVYFQRMNFFIINKSYLNKAIIKKYWRVV